MALREHIQIRETINVRKSRNKLMNFMLVLFAIFFNNILPFILGYYYFGTRSIFFLIPMLVVVFYNVEVR